MSNIASKDAGIKFHFVQELDIQWQIDNKLATWGLETK